MPDRIIIADASCLISLHNIDMLPILHELYGEIIITSVIRQEFGERLPEWIKISDPVDKNLFQILELELDPGEAGAIALAIETAGSLLIMDEKKGRLVAGRLGLPLMGTIGVLLASKRKGLITEIHLYLQRLEDVGFRIAPSLKMNVLRMANE